MSCGGDPTKPKKVEKKKSQTETSKSEATSSDVETKKKEVEEPKEEKKDEKKVIPTPPEHIEKAKEIIAAVASKDVEAVDAKKKFKMLCATCHGFNGKMMVNGATDLTKSKISLEESVAQVYHGKGLMTPFKGLLTDAEIVAVCQYIEKEFMK